MPTKKKKTSAKKRKPAPRMSPDERHLLVLIEATERAIDGLSESLDELFTQQAGRLKTQLADLRAKK